MSTITFLGLEIVLKLIEGSNNVFHFHSFLAEESMMIDSIPSHLVMDPYPM